MFDLLFSIPEVLAETFKVSELGGVDHTITSEPSKLSGTIVDFFYSFIVFMAILGALWGAMKWMTARETDVSSAKETWQKIITGLALALMAYFFVQIIYTLLKGFLN
ncbi:MAG: hypothetical protein U9Q15_03985 [Patescibacteria group bacterium]|nr:hypothetical protein [Patescibacteria group bacterium]